jgi:uncharacterized iron-regulated membrane protein
VKKFLHRPQSVFARRALFQVHLWIGVLVGAYIALICVTGAALVFRIDMQRALHPDLFTPSAEGPATDAWVIMESVKSSYPRDRLSGVDAPTTSRPTYLAYVTRGDRFLTLLLDPLSGRLLGELPEDSLVRTVQDLHFDLLAGRAGRRVNGIGAYLLLAMCVTGAIIWWQGVASWRRGFTVDFRRRWKRVTWELHSAIGIWMVLLISMWAVTGIYFAFPSGFRSAINWISPVSVARAPQSRPAPSPQPPLMWRTLIEKAQHHVPDQFVARVVVPSTGRAAFLVMFSNVRPTPTDAQLTSVYLDQFTGEVLDEPPRARQTVGDLVMTWAAPLHVGSFGGFGVKLAWLMLGLAPPLLFVTGFIMWWTRVVHPRWFGQRQSTVVTPTEPVR